MPGIGGHCDSNNTDRRYAPERHFEPHRHGMRALKVGNTSSFFPRVLRRGTPRGFNWPNQPKGRTLGQRRLFGAEPARELVIERHETVRIRNAGCERTARVCRSSPRGTECPQSPFQCRPSHCLVTRCEACRCLPPCARSMRRRWPRRAAHTNIRPRTWTPLFSTRVAWGILGTCASPSKCTHAA